MRKSKGQFTKKLYAVVGCQEKCPVIADSLKLRHKLNDSSERLLLIAKQFFKWLSIYLAHLLILHPSWGIRFEAHVRSSTSLSPDFPTDSLPDLRLLIDTPWACFMTSCKTVLMGPASLGSSKNRVMVYKKLCDSYIKGTIREQAVIEHYKQFSSQLFSSKERGIS